MKFLIPLLCVLGLLPASAQTTANPEAGLRFLSATSFNEPSTSTNYAYLTWQAQSADALLDQRHVIFSKPGTPTAGGSFTRRGSMSFQTELNILSALVDTAPPSILDVAALEPMIDDLFGDLIPGVGLDFPGKISGVMQAAKKDPAVFRRLLFLSRTHPFLGVCMGTGAIIPIHTTVTTFELRTLPPGSLELDTPPTVVAGRVTLDLANPPVITAPGAPVQVPDEGPSGHLNAKLRWGVPNPLRRQTPLTYGYNLYRMKRAFAESGGYHLTPPTPAVLLGLLGSDPAEVRLVNELPIMPTELMTVADAANLSMDPNPIFIVDDNGVLLDGGAPLADGDQFYYFATARDLLGRPGTLSDGTLVTICDRMRPLSPSRVKVQHIHDFGSTPEDFLRVSWEAPTSGDTPDSYYVYRWKNPEEMVAAETVALSAANLIAGPIAHDPATRRYEIDDTGSGAPSLPATVNETWWYSVRAVKSTSCGDLYGPNSAPGWGVLRDREGPNAAGGSVTITRFCPTFSLESDTTQSLSGPFAALFKGPGNGIFYYHIKLLRVDPRIRSARIYLCYEIQNPGGTTTITKVLGQKKYSVGDDLLDLKYKFSADIMSQSNVGLILCASDVNGKEVYKKVELEDLATPDPPGSYAELCFCVEEEEVTTVVSGGGVGPGGNTHTTLDPGTGEVTPIEVTFTPSAGTREYKLYKRIDGGPLLLVEQAEYDGSPSVTIEDSELPAYATKLCYFIQYFDEHGNPSPLADLGCLLTTNKVEMQAPILSQVEQTGTQGNPQCILKWFAQDDMADRFRVYICDGITSVPINYSNDLHVPQASISPLTGGAAVIFPGVLSGPSDRSTSTSGEPEPTFRMFETGRVDGNFPNTGTAGEYSLTLNVVSGREYKFYVESVSAAGDRSAPSNTVSFLWSQALTVGPEVPWPARALPAVDPDFIPEIEADYAEHEGEDRFYAGVQIGELIVNNNEDEGVSPGVFTTEQGVGLQFVPWHWPSNDTDYALELFTSSAGENALNCALYRYQVPNANFPNVSDDLVQVSPLIDQVRVKPYTAGREGLYDPFLTLLEDPDFPNDTSERYGLYIKDTQGAIRGAKYVYVLVRFKENGEIDRSIPTNELTIPLVDPS